jgi:site-specific DNA-adenine methylase
MSEVKVERDIIKKKAANVVRMAADLLAGEATCTVKKAAQLLAAAREDGRDEVEKSIWGSPAGKKHLAGRIVESIPPHRVYVEPFAGGAQVLFAKEPSEVEVVGDIDPDIAFAFRFARDVTPEKLERLRRKKWIGDKEHFRKLMESPVPEDDVDRFYRFAYLARFSFNKLRRGTMPDKNVGARARLVERLGKFAPRLKGVKVRCADYEKVIEEFDGPKTFFYLDPPYPGYDTDLGNDEWDEERFGKVLRKIKGKFLVTYGIRGESEDIFKGFHVKRWRHMSGVGASPGHGSRESVTMVVTNYQLKKQDDAPAETIEKTVWGSPAGKKKLAGRLVKLIPAHRIYVEPFAGSAAVFFAKEPVETEVLCDADPEIAFAFRFLKKLTSARLDKLRCMDWTGRETKFHKLHDAGSPRSDMERFYRFLYLSHFSYGKMRGKSFNRADEGTEATTVERIEEFAPRLKKVIVRCSDYEKVVKEFDGKETFFYLDPPYPGHDVGIGEDEFDEERFRKVLESIKGKFLLTYGTRGELDLSGFHVKRILPPRHIRSMAGVGGPRLLPTLLVTNYEFKEKDVEGVEDWSFTDLDKAEDESGEHMEKMSIKDISPVSLRGVDDQELLSLHRRLHQLFAGNFAGNAKLSAGDLKREDLINAEIFVQDEMSRRQMEHQADDDLASEAAKLRQTRKDGPAPILPGANGEDLDEITLSEVLPHFKSFKLRMPFLYLVGSLANHGKTQNDIDLLIKGPIDEDMLHVLKFRLGRMMPPHLSARMNLLDDTLGGPFTCHVELADLIVEMRERFDVKEMALAKQDDPLMDMPEKPGKHDAVLQYHFRGRSLHADLRLKIDNHLIGWTLSNPRADAIKQEVKTLEEARRITRTFSMEGDRYTKPFIAPDKISAFPKSRQPVNWLELEAEVFEPGSVGATRFEEGVILAVDRPKVEWGIQKAFFHEYFFTEGKALNGIMYFRLLTGQEEEAEEEIEAGRRTRPGETFWTCFVSKSYLPSVLKPRAVETKTMPPDGYSAIPQSLEQVTPREYRYWMAKGEEARKVRDALVESGFFNEDNVQLVDGEFRRVVKKLYLFSGGEEIEKRLHVPFQSWGGSGKYASRLAEKLPQHKKYVEPFCGSAAVFFAKERSEEEVLADVDPDVVFALLYVQVLTPGKIAALKRFDWKITREAHERAVKETRPTSDSQRFWKFVYGRFSSWGAKLGHGYSTMREGDVYPVDDLTGLKERLRGAKIEEADWRETLKKHDGKEALFFLDPPYEGEWGNKGGIPAAEIADAVGKIKGKWVVAYTNSAAARRALGKIGRLFTLRFPEARHHGGFANRRRLFATNCIDKAEGVDFLDEIAKQPRSVDFTLSYQAWKGQTVIRTAPSRQVWHLLLDDPDGGLESWILQADPLSGEDRITAVEKHRRSKDLLSFDGEAAPGQKVGDEVLNETKNTPSAIRIQDRGKAELLDDQRTFKKIRFDGDKLKGIFTLTQEEEGSDIWLFERGKEPSRSIPGKEVEKKIPVRDGVQIWDPGRKDPDTDRTELRPPAIFQPMKPAPRPTNEFRDLEEAIEKFVTPEMLEAGIYCEPKWNGFRFVVSKADDRILTFTEDTKRDLSPLLPNLSEELRSIDDYFILDGEFFDYNEAGGPVPRRELGAFRGNTPQDDSRAKVHCFDILYWKRHGNVVVRPLEERRKLLEEFFDAHKLEHLALSPANLCHTVAEIREAGQWARRIPGSEGAMLKLSTSTYSLGGENDAWAKIKEVREIRAIVYDRHPVKDSPGVFNFFGALGPISQDEADRWKETVEVGGKLYTPCGRSFNSKVPAKVGDVIRVEATEITVDRSGPKRSVTWFTPVVIDVTDEPPMTPEAVMDLTLPGEVNKLIERAMERRIPLVKTKEERYVLGIVLEPETVDAQKDIYSAAEIRAAAHGFMEKFARIGLMHRAFVDGDVKILESYLAPVDFSLDGARIKEGTWLLAVRIINDDLWRKVKQGVLSGFSIGGSAARKIATDIILRGASNPLK